MNYLAHAYRFLDRPMFVAGTSLPDWMNVLDRKNRPQRKYAAKFLEDADRALAEVAAGVVQHHRDDAWFHAQPAFLELCSRFSKQLRTRLSADQGHQAAFLGHISVELLMDATLIERQPDLLDDYYRILESLDRQRLQTAVNRILRTPENHLAIFLDRFSQERFLADYVTDAGLQHRLSGVMRRIGLPPLPDLTDWLSQARQLVRDRIHDLLPLENSSNP